MWQPDVTVAAICEVDGRFLMVEEKSKSSGKIVINQPAGHLEDKESLLEAVIRETLEETGRHFTPEQLVGLYRLRLESGKTYIRYTFCGAISDPVPNYELDSDIIRTLWKTHSELTLCPNLRSPMVLGCVEDYLAGARFSLDLLREL